MGMKSDGSLVVWGANHFDQCDRAPGSGGFVGISAGLDRSLCLRGAPSSRVQADTPGRSIDVGGVRLLAVFPKPCSEETSVRFEASQTAKFRLSALGADGRLVTTVPPGLPAPGVHRAAWNGRGIGDMPAAAGVYFLRVEGGRAVSKATRVVMIR